MACCAYASADVVYMKLGPYLVEPHGPVDVSVVPACVGDKSSVLLKLPEPFAGDVANYINYRNVCKLPTAEGFVPDMSLVFNRFKHQTYVLSIRDLMWGFSDPALETSYGLYKAQFCNDSDYVGLLTTTVLAWIFTVRELHTQLTNTSSLSYPLDTLACLITGPVLYMIVMLVRLVFPKRFAAWREYLLLIPECMVSLVLAVSALKWWGLCLPDLVYEKGLILQKLLWHPIILPAMLQSRVRWQLVQSIFNAISMGTVMLETVPDFPVSVFVSILIGASGLVSAFMDMRPRRKFMGHIMHGGSM